jgi:hypothetical protein
MRTVLLLPLALAAALAAGGCGTASDGTDQTAFRVPQRDLTLQPAAAPDVEVASPVELARTPVQPRSTHRPQHARRPERAPRREATQPEAAAPAAARTNVDAISPATSLASEPPDPHALAPGQSVTVIPASGGASSAGPSSAPDWTDQRPAEGGRGTRRHGGGDGDGCGHGGRGRHPGGGGFQDSESP